MNLNLREMSREEKLQAMQALWEDLAQAEEAVESPPWHADALQETERRVQAGVERSWDWEEAKAELRNRGR